MNAIWCLVMFPQTTLGLPQLASLRPGPGIPSRRCRVRYGKLTPSTLKPAYAIHVTPISLRSYIQNQTNQRPRNTRIHLLKCICADQDPSQVSWMAHFYCLHSNAWHACNLGHSDDEYGQQRMSILSQHISDLSSPQHTKNISNLFTKTSPSSVIPIGSKDTVEFWSHREKLVIVAVDNHFACVGGLDLCFGRWALALIPPWACIPLNLSQGHCSQDKITTMPAS